MFSPSPQQSRYFDWLRNGSGSLVLVASAGSGKTTTLIEGLPFMTGRVFLGAYNKSIASEIDAKVSALLNRHPAKVEVKVGTMHAAGFGVLRRNAKRLEVDEKKSSKVLHELALRDDRFAYAELHFGSFMTRMVSFGKQHLMGVTAPIDDMDEWLRIMRHFSADEDLPEKTEPEYALGLAIELLKASNDPQLPYIDFDDMCYLPCLRDLRFYPYDWFIGDEWQDANPARREIARRMLGKDGRAVFVGDDRQAIYGFTGAMSDSLEETARMFNCQRMPLSVTYRCPKAVVSYVHQWVGEQHIQAHPDAPQGEVRSVLAAPEGDARPWFLRDVPSATDAILCRLNKPLVATAYAMLREGVACKVEGRDIGRGLIALASRWKVKSLDALDKRLDAFLDREIAKARKVDSPAREQAVIDKVETLRIFMARCRARSESTLACVVAEIENLFGDNVRNVVTLSSGHKAKGREWPRVFWLQTKELPARQDWEKMQEANLKYVVSTRVVGNGALVLVPEANGKNEPTKEPAKEAA